MKKENDTVESTVKEETPVLSMVRALVSLRKLYPRTVEKREDGYWYHDNNVSGLMLIALVAGVGIGIICTLFIAN